MTTKVSLGSNKTPRRPKKAGRSANKSANAPSTSPPTIVGQTVLNEQFYAQNPYVKLYRKCIYNGVEWLAGEYVVELDEKEMKRGSLVSIVATPFSKSVRGRIISAFMKEEDIIYVILQEVVAKEELKRKKFENSNSLDAPFYIGSTLITYPLEVLNTKVRKAEQPVIGKSKWADLDKKLVLDGSWPYPMEKLKAGGLANRNVTIYHPRFRRCMAIVIGILEHDSKDKSKRTNDELQLDNEDALLLRFYYKHDEPDINKADTEGRVSEVVSKVNFRKAPRLWSNHLGITRAKIQKIEEDCYYTLPGDAMNVPQTCCFFMYNLPQHKISDLPIYLLKWSPGHSQAEEANKLLKKRKAVELDYKLIPDAKRPKTSVNGKDSGTKNNNHISREDEVMKRVQGLACLLELARQISSDTESEDDSDDGCLLAAVIEAYSVTR